jgi:hypothetical protein
MFCVICKSEYKGHFNSLYCSTVCKKKGKQLVNLKYNERKRFEKTRLLLDLKNEEWIDIEGYQGVYKISNFGRVKSIIRKGGGGFLKNTYGKNGYYSVGLRKKGHGMKTKSIHRLLALHFITNPKNLPIVDHIDRDKKNNTLKNLRWASYSTNGKNSNQCELSSCLTRTYEKGYHGYRAFCNKKSKRSKSLVKCCVWIFENNPYLMKHVSK